jgi:hypothetical protein
MLFISQLERKTTQRLPSPQRKDGLRDGRTDGRIDRQTDSWEHERQKRKKTTAASFAATTNVSYNTEEKAKSLFSQHPRKKHKTRKHKIDEDDELQGFCCKFQTHFFFSFFVFFFFVLLLLILLLFKPKI